ncbi:MAG: hypothetical protein LBC97_11890 [Bifidobacteriaceae bacterium]|jgi:hypothetical protein|nr:hypothetical protein [Bifidobacteriaceae bacterium]
MARTYRPKTRRKRQEDRDLRVVSVANDPLDEGALVNVFLMHTISCGLPPKNGADRLTMLRRQLPPRPEKLRTQPA